MKTTLISLTRKLSPQLTGIIKYNLLTAFVIICLQTAQAGTFPLLVNHQYNKQPVFINELLISNSGQNLILSWQADRSSFDYYEIEKSLDGKTFKTIGLVLDAPENSNLCLFKDK